MSDDEERLLTGVVRPSIVPPHWVGEPMPENMGWRWMDPTDRGNSVRIIRPDPEAEDPSYRVIRAVVTVRGEVIDEKRQPTGIFIDD